MAGPVIVQFVVGLFAENTYLVGCPATGKAALFDPGGDNHRVLSEIERRGWTLEKVVGTHAHIDHILGVAGIVEATGVPYLLHADEQVWIDNAESAAAMFGIPFTSRPKVDAYIEEGTRLEIGDLCFAIEKAPGHSPGHVIFVTEAHALVGDCVFAGSIGRTDLPGGDHRTLLESIRDQILTLPDDTVLYPGHGPTTTVGAERRTNPFLVGLM